MPSASASAVRWRPSGEVISAASASSRMFPHSTSTVGCVGQVQSGEVGAGVEAVGTHVGRRLVAVRGHRGAQRSSQRERFGRCVYRERRVGIGDVEAVRAGGVCTVGVNRHHGVGTGLVADRGAFVDAGPDAGVVGTRQHHREPFDGQQIPHPLRDVPGEGVLEIPSVGRRAGGVARLRPAATVGHGAVDDIGIRGIGAVVAGVEHDGARRRCGYRCAHRGHFHRRRGRGNLGRRASDVWGSAGATCEREHTVQGDQVRSMHAPPLNTAIRLR